MPEPSRSRRAAEGRRADPATEKQIARFRPQVAAYGAPCEEPGQEPATVALAWLLHNPVVTAPMVGPRDVERSKASLPALDLVLSEGTLSRLDAIWPGPGGEAPMAYAW